MNQFYNFNLQQSKKEKILTLEFDFSLLKRKIVKFFLNLVYLIFKNIYYPLDILTKHHTLLGLFLSLTLGITISLVVFSQPDQTQAFPTIISSKQIKQNYQELQFLSYKYPIINSTQGQKRQDIALLNERISSSNINFLEINNYTNLRKLSLGDKIQLLAQNNGLYTFTITEIRELEKDQLNILNNQFKERVVIYASKGKLSNKYHCLLATLKTKS